MSPQDLPASPHDPAPAEDQPFAEPRPNPAKAIPAPSAAPGGRARLLLILGLLLLGVGACRFASRPGDQPLRPGDRPTWLQLQEGGDIQLEPGMTVGAVRGEWFSLRPPQGKQDRWLRLRDVKSFSLQR
jgi:hypothetical protein